MVVLCQECGKIYRDEDCWTICPHNLLEAAPDAPYYNCGNHGYCAGHDLFNCTLGAPTEADEHSHVTVQPPSEDGADDDTMPDEEHEFLETSAAREYLGGFPK